MLSNSSRLRWRLRKAAARFLTSLASRLLNPLTSGGTNSATVILPFPRFFGAEETPAEPASLEAPAFPIYFLPLAERLLGVPEVWLSPLDALRCEDAAPDPRWLLEPGGPVRLPRERSLYESSTSSSSSSSSSSMSEPEEGSESESIILTSLTVMRGVSDFMEIAAGDMVVGRTAEEMGGAIWAREKNWCCTSILEVGVAVDPLRGSKIERVEDVRSTLLVVVGGCGRVQGSAGKLGLAGVEEWVWICQMKRKSVRSVSGPGRVKQPRNGLACSADISSAVEPARNQLGNQLMRLTADYRTTDRGEQEESKRRGFGLQAGSRELGN